MMWPSGKLYNPTSASETPYFENGSFRRSHWFWPCVVAILLGGMLWLWNNAYQSHYLSALRMLGDTTAHAYWGQPKEGRGDEWATYLPMLKQDYLEGFRKTSRVSPYHEKLEWFISLPHKDLSLLFLPNQILYWVAPGGKALSFQGLYYNLLLIFSLAWLLKNLGVRTGMAITSALLILFSQFYQLWWTSNVPALGALFLPLAIFTSNIRLWARVIMLWWTVCHVLFGQMYPPLYVALTLGVMPIVLTIRKDLCTWRYLLVTGIAVVAGLLVYVLMKWDFFNAVSHTTYPGHRVSLGGGGSLSMLLAAVFPGYPATSFSGGSDRLYEMSAASTVMGVLVIGCIPTMKWDALQIRLTIVTLVVFGGMSIFVLVGFPRYLAIATSLSLLPTNRVQFGLSLVVLLYSVVTLSRQLRWVNLTNMSAVLLLYGIILHAVKQPDYVLRNVDGIQFAPIIAVAGGLMCLCAAPFAGWSKRNLHVVTGVAWLFLVGGVLTYGRFNPVMDASLILKPVSSQFISGWKALFAANGGEPFAVGSYGHVLRGENLAALEAIQMANVDPAVYKRVFPELTNLQNRQTFNKFVGIAFANIEQPDLSGVTAVFPLEGHSLDLLGRIYRVSPSPSILDGPVRITSALEVDGETDVRWSGLLANGVSLPAVSRVALSLPCNVSGAWLTRQPNAFVTSDKPYLPVIEGRVRISTTSKEEAENCAKNISAFAQKD